MLEGERRELGVWNTAQLSQGEARLKNTKEFGYFVGQSSARTSLKTGEDSPFSCIKMIRKLSNLGVRGVKQIQRIEPA